MTHTSIMNHMSQQFDGALIDAWLLLISYYSARRKHQACMGPRNHWNSGDYFYWL